MLAATARMFMCMWDLAALNQLCSQHCNGNCVWEFEYTHRFAYRVNWLCHTCSCWIAARMPTIDVCFLLWIRGTYTSRSYAISLSCNTHSYHIFWAAPQVGGDLEHYIAPSLKKSARASPAHHEDHDIFWSAEATPQVRFVASIEHARLHRTDCLDVWIWLVSI